MRKKSRKSTGVESESSRREFDFLSPLFWADMVELGCMSPMTYASVCDGIGAIHCAWKPLGWQCEWTAEIKPFPAAVVHARHGLINLGDFTRILRDVAAKLVRLLVGGTPCQSFSIAGLREGLDSPNGNLALEYLALAERLRCPWLVWENVPGVLSSGGGRDFGTFLGALAKLGYGWAYRVLDAQYFAVPQRRRRVFVVGYLGDWRRAAAVLFERHSLQGNSAPSRETRENVAGTLGARTCRSVGAQDAQCNHFVTADVAPTLNAHFGSKQGLENQHLDSGGGLFVSCKKPDFARGSL